VLDKLPILGRVRVVCVIRTWLVGRASRAEHRVAKRRTNAAPARRQEEPRDDGTSGTLELEPAWETRRAPPPPPKRRRNQ
jgi:hypothetical protein